MHDYSTSLVWEDDAEKLVRPLLQVTENTAKALKAAFGRLVACCYSGRRYIRTYVRRVESTLYAYAVV